MNVYTILNFGECCLLLIQTRMKLGFRSKDLGEWRIDMEN